MSTAAGADQVLTTDETEERRPHAEGGEHGPHPKDSQYILVAAILAVITGVEVAMSYLKVAYLTNFTLLALAVVKFTMVAMFFMHLRFDNRVFRRFFITGIVLAIAVYLIVLLTFGVFSHQHHLTPGFNGQ